MSAFDLDMAFEPDEVVAGLERLFTKLGLAWTSVPGSAHHEFTVTLPRGGAARIIVRPLPAERQTYIALFPRTLLEASGHDGVELEPLRREIVLAFLRVAG